jgi:hypothetical protein
MELVLYLREEDVKRLLYNVRMMWGGGKGKKDNHNLLISFI